MLKYSSQNYEGDERTNIDKDGDLIVSSNRLLINGVMLVDLIVGLH